MAGMHLDHVKKNMKVLFFVDNAKKLISKKILGKKKFIILKLSKLLILTI